MAVQFRPYKKFVFQVLFAKLNSSNYLALISRYMSDVTIQFINAA